MKRTATIVSSIIVLATALLTMAQEPEPPVPTGRRLREIVAEKFPDGRVLIGGTTGSWSFGRPTGTVMDREFGYVTPENDFKQSVVHPDPDTWRWARADAWVRHVAGNGQVLRIHGPISPQCSRWAKNDARTPAELEKLMREFATALYQRYNGKGGFFALDVVNETVVNGKWHTDKKGTPWEVPWFRLGQDSDENRTPLYIKMAFEMAKKHAPDFKLIFNHHEDASKENSWDLIKKTIRYLREGDLRVDGIGWQAHVDNGWATPANIEKLRALIDWAHAHDLEFHVTEASVWIKDGVTPESLELQAQTYSAIVAVLLEKSESGKVAWNTWHIDDPHSWHRQWHGGLFDARYAPKPAYYAIQKTLEEAKP
ncbi:MAG: endo-1,4-beta-xylanase [Phycisphaerales bacterium]|nr:MAG: endo-1,4-beta-xylanase [Phycisphaerales bacterium]